MNLWRNHSYKTWWVRQTSAFALHRWGKCSELRSTTQVCQNLHYVPTVLFWKHIFYRPGYTCNTGGTVLEGLPPVSYQHNSTSTEKHILMLPAGKNKGQGMVPYVHPTALGYIQRIASLALITQCKQSETAHIINWDVLGGGEHLQGFPPQISTMLQLA